MSVITLDDLKAHLNITIDADDDLLTDKLAAAQESVEGFIGSKLDDTAFPDGIPNPLKEAVRQYAAHLYESREPIVIGSGMNAVAMPLGVFDLVGPYRAWVF
jgi:uncharacterized phage protein (predicted DNA packaging)